MLGSITILIGLILIGLSFWFRSRAKAHAAAAASWPTADGKVLESSVKEERSYDQDDGLQITYSPQLTYSYSAAGEEHQSHKISFGGSTSYNTQAEAQKQADKYPAGSAVKVYYDPKNPKTAVLELKASSNWIIALVIGGFVLVVGIIWLVHH